MQRTSLEATPTAAMSAPAATKPPAAKRVRRVVEIDHIVTIEMEQPDGSWKLMRIKAGPKTDLESDPMILRPESSLFKQLLGKKRHEVVSVRGRVRIKNFSIDPTRKHQ